MLTSFVIASQYFKSVVFCRRNQTRLRSFTFIFSQCHGSSVFLSFSGVYNGPDRTGLAVDSQTGPNIATCCCVNGRGLSMFDLRMPLPMDFIYDVSYFIPVAIGCSEKHSI